MFYSTFLTLCNERNISPSAAAVDMGFQKSVVTRWKNGTVPRDANLSKVASYFGVTVDYLLTGEEPATLDSRIEMAQLKNEASAQLDAEEEELNEYLNELKNNPGMRVLFSKTKNAKKEDIEKVIKMLDIMRGEDDDRGYY